MRAAVEGGVGQAQDLSEIPAEQFFTDNPSPLPMDRLFARDRTNTVSLRALPTGEDREGSALIALIYGASKLAGEHQVSGVRLMKAAEQSGLQVERIDRALNPHIGPIVTSAGARRGRKYGLTNPGLKRAEEILRGILG